MDRMESFDFEKQIFLLTFGVVFDNNEESVNSWLIFAAYRIWEKELSEYWLIYFIKYIEQAHDRFILPTHQIALQQN